MTIFSQFVSPITQYVMLVFYWNLVTVINHTQQSTVTLYIQLSGYDYTKYSTSIAENFE